MVIAKYRASSPTPLWRVTWDGGGTFAQGYTLAVDRKGDVGVCGSSSVPSRGYAVVKFSGKDGHVLWERDLGAASYKWAVDIAVDKSNNVYVTGNVNAGALSGNAIVTMKLSAGGAWCGSTPTKAPCSAARSLRSPSTLSATST